MSSTGNRRVGGRIYVKVNGAQYQAKGEFDYGLGLPKQEAVLGQDGVHGYKTTEQAPYIEGKITDSVDLDLAALAQTDNATVTLELANGKVIALREAWFAGEAKGNTGEGEIEFRFEGMSGEEVR